MRKINCYQPLFAIFLVGAFGAQAQSYPDNSFSPQAQPYTTYPAQPMSSPQPIVTQPAQVVAIPQGVVVPPGVVYVGPTYPAPAVGFVWAYHPSFGWGWRHRAHGWHRGWR